MQEGQSVGRRVRSHDAGDADHFIRETEFWGSDEAAAVRAARVAMMAERYETGVDIWTGQALRGQDATNWLELQDGRPETGDTDDEAAILLD